MACTTLAAKLSSACTSGIAKLRDPIPLKQIIAQSLCRKVTYTVLENFSTTTNASSYATTNSYQPAANTLVLAICDVTKTTQPLSVPTFSGNGLTWDLINTIQMTNGGLLPHRISIFRAMGAAPTLTVGTLNNGADACTGAFITMVQVSNTDTTGTNGSGAIVQTAGNAPAAGINATVNFAQDPCGGVIVAIGDMFNQLSTIIPPLGYTVLAANSIASPTAATAIIATDFPDSKNVISTTLSTVWATIGVEIKVKS